MGTIVTLIMTKIVFDFMLHHLLILVTYNLITQMYPYYVGGEGFPLIFMARYPLLTKRVFTELVETNCINPCN